MKLLSTTLAISLLLCAIQHDMAQTVTQEQRARKFTRLSVPALFAFGDSIVDTGNNNVKMTIAKSNFLPYGSNFVTHKPTGRFCNGKIPPDFLASKLGIKELLPAYLGTSLTNQDLITGVSFASGGTGYDPLTAKTLSVISMPEQLEMFKEYKEKVKRIVGEKKAADIVSQSMYLIMAGSDDVADTYFTTPFRRPQYDFSGYANLLLQAASTFLEQLIQLGARRIAILGLPPIGCLPSQRTLGGRIVGGCASDQNELVRIYNSRLSNEVEKIRTRHQDLTLIYVDVYDIFYDMIEHPTKYGFEISNQGCCGTGLMEVAILCNPTSMVCADVSKHVFWDSYHPSEKAYSIMADYVYKRYFAHIFG